MLAPSSIPELVDKFSRSRDAYVSHEYNETQLRREFLDPFFGALGWDIENKQGHAEAYKDVIHEDAIKIGSATKAPDYSFRVGGIRKFFVEAKKPSVNLREDAAPAYQLRRYAWSAKLPLSVLTDFQEFVVYDCRVKPFPHDKPSTGRTLYLPYTEYETRWAEIADVFSKEAVLKGSFDKYAETNKSKKGTAEVDDAFLQEIETWRKTLAANIALRNPKLTQRELNAAVQRTIDRIIFLRICEDRGIETYGTLMAFQNGLNTYKRLIEVFHRADEKYNSGLFHFREESNRGEAPDELTLSLAIDDKPLKEIIKNLYYPDSPYEFSVLPADILGQVYEQFLGKVIRLTTGHHAVVEDKPEVKKAGGVYYTPTYIVEYIVKNTVGKILSGDAAKPLTPKQVARLRVLDPACGSGSFLIGAYQHLLDWHRDWYVKDGADKWTKGRSPALYQSQEGEWRLTTMERKRILLNNIYGVDIDAQAVETTKLSLLLKVLEGENEQTISRQLKMFQERALPDLGNNIKCGNSLIGPDFYSGDLFSAREPQGHGSRQKDAGDDERMRINPFDWNTGFKEIMDGGGFDAVIGNPPYGALFGDVEKRYLQTGYHSMVGKYDSYGFFIEKSLQLLRDGAILGYITPHTWLTVLEARSLRGLILENARVIEVVRLPSKVFKSATVNTILSFLIRERKKELREKTIIRAVITEENAKFNNAMEIVGRVNEFHQLSWSTTEAQMFNIDISAQEQVLISKVKQSTVPLHTLCDFAVGVQAYDQYTGQDSKTIEGRAYHSDRKKNKSFRRELTGSDVSRYSINWAGDSWISYGEWLAHPRQPRFFEGPRILVREITGQGHHMIHAAFTADDYVNYKTVLTVLLANASGKSGYNLLYFLGLLNSNLMSWFFPRSSNKLVTETFPRISILDMKRFPARIINFSDPADKSRHDKMVSLVGQMLDLHKKLAASRLDHEQTALQRQIDETDKQIDDLVYELYGLTDEEIKIVESR